MNKFVYCAKLKTGEIRYGLIEATDGLDMRRRLRPLEELSIEIDFFGVTKHEQHRELGRPCANTVAPELNPSNQLSTVFIERRDCDNWGIS